MVGLAIGVPAGYLAGPLAEYMAAAAQVAAGLWMIFSGEDGHQDAAACWPPRGV